MLIGKAVKHSWTKGIAKKACFETIFCNERELVWNNITDLTKITSEKNAYIRTDITDGIVQISWRENPKTTNYGLIWTLDFNKHKIYGVIVNALPNENLVVEGNFKVIELPQMKPGVLHCS